MNYDIRDLSLAGHGQQRIAWAAHHMPVLRQIQTEFASERPFQNRRIAASLHITTETAILLYALRLSLMVSPFMLSMLRIFLPTNGTSNRRWLSNHTW